MRTGRLGIVLLVWLVVAAAPASARAEPTEEQLQEAERRYRTGQTHYDLGEFEQAVAEFKAAYELSRAPALLFNIGQAYRLAKNHEQAIFFYRSYLRSEPNAQERPLVEQRIAELEQLIREQGPSDPPDDLPPDEPPPDQPPDHPPDRPDTARPGRGLKIAGAVAGALGVVLIGAGAYMATSAAAQWDEINGAAGGDTPWSAELQAKYDGARADERTSTILFVAGGVGVVAGATLYYLGMRRAARATRVAVVPSTRGAVLGVSWEF